jgi:hypothetical protein
VAHWSMRSWLVLRLNQQKHTLSVFGDVEFHLVANGLVVEAAGKVRIEGKVLVVHLK